MEVTTGREDPATVANRFVVWLEGVPGEKIAVGMPASMDFEFINYYCWRYVGSGYRVSLEESHEPGRRIFGLIHPTPSLQAPQSRHGPLPRGSRTARSASPRVQLPSAAEELGPPCPQLEAGDNQRH